jgi:hypothetical protein
VIGHEADLQEEVDAAVRRREAIEAEDEYNDRRHYNERSVKDIIERHSQRQDPLPAASLLLRPSSSSGDSGENVGKTGGVRWSR